MYIFQHAVSIGLTDNKNKGDKVRKRQEAKSSILGAFTVERRPEWVSCLHQQKPQGEIYVELAQTLGGISADEHISFNLEQFCKVFRLESSKKGESDASFAKRLRSRMTYVKAQLKKRGIKTPRVATKNGIVYIWKVNV
jgi:hypothetical protein